MDAFDAFNLLATDDTQEPPELVAIVRSLLLVGAEHWQHDYQLSASRLQEGKPPAWLQKTYKTLHEVKAGTFGAHFPREYLAQLPDPKALHTPVSWEAVSQVTHASLRTMFRMPDYSCGSVFYPNTLDRWLRSGDPRQSQTSCFLRMLWSERQAPRWSLSDLAKAPSKERALIARIKDALDAQEVSEVSRIYRDLDNPIREDTFWTRVGIVAHWLQEPDVQETRDQFGVQEDRAPHRRHGTRWDTVARLPALVWRLSVLNGQGRGWFVVPGDSGWSDALASIAMESGVYLYRVVVVERSGKPATSGCLTGSGVEEVYLSDYAL